MKFKLFNAGLFLLLCVGAAAQQPSSKASYVDPFIGTDGMGHTFPGRACLSAESSLVLTRTPSLTM